MNKLITQFAFALLITIAVRSEEHSYSRTAFRFSEDVTYNLVNVYNTKMAGSEATMVVNNNNLTVNHGKCSFGGKYTYNASNIQFAFTNVMRTMMVCNGPLWDMEARMGSLTDPKNGYALRMKVYNSDWLIIGVENPAAKKIDMLIGQHVLSNGNPVNTSE